MEGMWPGEELKAKGKELELEGWRAWKAEVIARDERYWEGGTKGCWHGGRDPGWLRVAYAAWKVHWATTQAGETGAAQERSVEEMTKQYSEELAKRTEGKRKRAEEEPRRGHPISEECQAWKAARLVAIGEAKVPRLRSGCRAKPAPKAGIEIGAGAGQPRAVLGKVGGATVQQGGEEARGDTQGEVVPETGVGVGAGQQVVWKGPSWGEISESGVQANLPTGNELVRGDVGFGPMLICSHLPFAVEVPAAVTWEVGAHPVVRVSVNGELCFLLHTGCNQVVRDLGHCREFARRRRSISKARRAMDVIPQGPHHSCSRTGT